MAGTESICKSRISQWLVLDLYATVEYYSDRYWICVLQYNITVAGTGSVCNTRISQWQVLDMLVTVEYHSGWYWICMQQ